MITFKAKEASGEIINSALHEFTFPAGEKHIKHTEGRPLQPVEIAVFQPTPDSIHNDLFTLSMWSDYILRHDYEIAKKSPGYAGTTTVLIMPYVPGARADRGKPFGLQIYSEFINDLFLDQIIVFDPHSTVTGEVLGDGENLTVVHSDELFNQKHMRAVLNQYNGIIAPDKGAKDRAQAVANVADLPVFTATKTRDEDTGKLSNFAIEGLDPDGTYLIIDDICDGGGTFLGLAKAAGLDFGSLDLYVSHGVFSKEAVANLALNFEYVYTTNSYNPERDLSGEFYPKPSPFRRFDVIRLLESKIF
jgi:ribose-phosphate pyrophosphokinase